MSFLTQNIAIPVWMLILMGLVVLSVIVTVAVKMFRARRQGSNVTKTAEKNRQRLPDEKGDITNLLQLLSAEGDKGILLRSVSDRLGISTSSAQQAMAKLAQSRMVEEVVGVSGTRYYLTRLGKQYCASKNM
jgi:hypothetical protein